MSDVTDERIAALTRTVAADPGADGFAALAELHRRAGRLEDAERVATRGLAVAPDSLDGRAVLALVLADAGRDADLRHMLEGWAERAISAGASSSATDADDAFSVTEIDRAFDAAEPDAESLITPDSVAEEAALQADGPMALESPLEMGGAFATRTMADLLERQGDHDGAARIRARLDEASVAAISLIAESERDHDIERAPDLEAEALTTIAVLERWLENSRRMQT